jgi:hypothetical protein
MLRIARATFFQRRKPHGCEFIRQQRLVDRAD